MITCLSMPFRTTPKLLLTMLVAAACAALVLTTTAAATTGIEVTIPIKVAITEKGVVFTPAVHELHPDTDTTYRVRVVNRAWRGARPFMAMASDAAAREGGTEGVLLHVPCGRKGQVGRGDVKAPSREAARSMSDSRRGSAAADPHAEGARS